MKAESSYRPAPQESTPDLPLLKAGDEEYGDYDHPVIEKWSRRFSFRHTTIFIIFHLVIDLMVIVGVLNVYLNAGPSNPIFPQMLYSPVQHLLEYEMSVFHVGFAASGDKSIYQQPPAPEVDAAWEKLYNFGISRITKAEASQLWNSTYRLPGDEDHYVVMLDVFHQLHCLNSLRKELYSDYYKNDMSDDEKSEHWGHCIESIRQSLMCSADVSQIVWQWVDKHQEVRPVGNVAHTCRNFEKIRQWGVDHQIDHVVNFTGFK